MMILITYDVNTQDAGGKRRLTRVAKICVNYGQRVQNSVFECVIDYGTFLSVKNSILKEIDEKKDSVRFYLLGNNWKNHVEHCGAKPSYDPTGLLTV